MAKVKVESKALLKIIKRMYDIEEYSWILASFIEPINETAASLLTMDPANESDLFDEDYVEALLIFNNYTAFHELYYVGTNNLFELSQLEKKIGFERKLSKMIGDQISDLLYKNKLIDSSMEPTEETTEIVKRIDKEIARIKRMIKAGGEE